MTEVQLNECLGRKATEVIERLDLGRCRWFWSDEPPMVLRGVWYVLAEDACVALFVAEGEPLFRQFDQQRQWNYAEFLGCRVGGLQYLAGKVRLDVGPAVPWQWRRRL